jgi:phosphate-selective porin OprO and OprP
MRIKVLTTAALAALATAGAVGAAQAQPAPATTTTWNGAPESREGEQRFKIRGRFQYDITSNDWDTTAEDGSRSYVRRAFIGAQGRLTDHWRYKVDFVLNPGANEAGTVTATTLRLCQNIATSVLTQRAACLAGETNIGPVVTGVSGGGAGGDDVAVDDAYLEYAGDFYSFVIGENNVTAPLEDRTSSLDIPFAERSSMINTFGYGRAAGAALLVTGANWTAAAGVYGDSLNNQDANFSLDESSSISGRVTWTPMFEASPEGMSLIHLGLTGRERYIADDAGQRFRARPLNGRGTRHIDAGTGIVGESDTSWGGELALQYNQFGLSAEYARLEGTETPAGGGASFSFDGYYVDAFWSITGEARNYRGNTGSFGAVIPRQPINQGGIGHLMLSARYDYIDLTDPAGSAATRGEQSAYALGLDWIPLDHVRVKLNYAESEMDRTGAATVDDQAQIVTLRTQFDF